MPRRAAKFSNESPTLTRMRGLGAATSSLHQYLGDRPARGLPLAVGVGEILPLLLVDRSEARPKTRHPGTSQWSSHRSTSKRSRGKRVVPAEDIIPSAGPQIVNVDM